MNRDSIRKEGLVGGARGSPTLKKRLRRSEGAGVLRTRTKEICLEARRHGIVLARPLFWAIVLAGAGGVLATLPRPFSLGSAAVVALGALVALRAVWKWERTRVVVTTEKVFVVGGTWRKRARARAPRRRRSGRARANVSWPAPRLRDSGRGPAGPRPRPKPKNVYRLVERLAG